jgi:hypothetical protein
MKWPAAAILVSALALTGAALAQGNGNGKSNGNKNSPPTTAGSGTTLAVSLITAFERTTILGYVQNNRAAFPGTQPLPPGIAKKLARGGSLPPGIAKRYFPNDLLGRLPPRPGQQWLVMGTDVVLLDTATQIILDLLHP